MLLLGMALLIETLLYVLRGRPPSSLEYLTKHSCQCLLLYGATVRILADIHRAGRHFFLHKTATNKTRLDESTAHQHLKSPQSLSGRSLHLTLVTKWPRSHMTFKIQILIQGHGQGQTHWSYLRPRVQINMFAFRFVAIGPVLVEIYKNSYFTLKIQGQGHIQGQI